MTCEWPSTSGEQNTLLWIASKPIKSYNWWTHSSRKLPENLNAHEWKDLDSSGVASCCFCGRCLRHTMASQLLALSAFERTSLFSDISATQCFSLRCRCLLIIEYVAWIGIGILKSLKHSQRHTPITNLFLRDALWLHPIRLACLSTSEVHSIRCILHFNFSARF